MLRLFTNPILYLVYFFGLIGFAAIMEALRLLKIVPRPSVVGQVTRANISMTAIHGTFVVISGLNVGIASPVFTFMPPRIGRFSFGMILLETLTFAYLIYWNGWVRNKILGIIGQATTDRR